MLLLLLASCGSSRKVEKQSDQVAVQEINLTPEQQRKYDYFFLEASRLKVKKEYTAAFDLLQHCLTINPTGSAALYEIAQYYLSLNKCRKDKRHWRKQSLMPLIIIGIVRHLPVCTNSRIRKKKR